MPVTMASASFVHDPEAGARPVAVHGRTSAATGRSEYGTPSRRDL